MSTIEDQLTAAKDRFSTETAAAIGGNDSAWHRAEIARRDVQRIVEQIKAQPPAPAGVWAEAARLHGKGE
jgi:hypothetical protein